jgi:hypothetical protein
VELRPRHYAAEICALKTKEERRAALDQVPAIWRAMTRDHVESYFAMRILWQKK